MFVLTLWIMVTLERPTLGGCEQMFLQYFLITSCVGLEFPAPVAHLSQNRQGSTSGLQRRTVGLGGGGGGGVLTPFFSLLQPAAQFSSSAS